jgi:hypothetical protein
MAEAMTGGRVDYEREYDEFWRDIVENPDGTLNKDQVMRELSDYSGLMRRAAEVYEHVTGGRISKPETAARAVIQQHDEHVMEAVERASAEAG